MVGGVVWIVGLIFTGSARWGRARFFLSCVWGWCWGGDVVGKWGVWLGVG